MIERMREERTLTATIVGFCLSIVLVNAAPHHTSNTIDCHDSGNPADVIFLLDASNSIWRPDFTRQIQFIKELSRMFRIGPHHTQIAVITYADYPQFQFHLNYYSTKSDIIAAIDSIRQMGGYHTSTPDALRTMRERGFNTAYGARPNVTRVGIVITDGNSDEREKTVAEAERVKDAGIHLFAVGVGMALDISELEAIASPPSMYYTFTVGSYAGLDNIKELLAIKACTVTDPPTTPSTTTVATTTTTSPSTTTTTTTTTATTRATVAPSTEDPLSKRTPELEEPRSASDPEQLIDSASERPDEVDEFQGQHGRKPETGHSPTNDVRENDPGRSKSSTNSRGSDADEGLTRNGIGNGGSHPDVSGQDGREEEERTRGGRGGGEGTDEVEGTQGTPEVNDYWVWDDASNQWVPKDGSDSNQLVSKNDSTVGNNYWVWSDALKQWVPKIDSATNQSVLEKDPKVWPDDLRQDGEWVTDESGRTIWVKYSDVTPVNGMHVPNSGSDLDYAVDPVEHVEPERHKNKDSTKDGKNGRKPSKSGGRKEGGGTGKDNGGNGKQSNGKKNSEGCRPKTPLDVVFIIDPKTRDRRVRRHLLETVRNTVGHIDMDNGQMRVQFVQSCPKKTDRQRNRSNKHKSPLMNTIEDLVTPPQRSTAELFQAMTSKLTTNGKTGRKRVGVYLTNGPSGDLEETLEAVQEAKNIHDVEMFTVGIGRDLNPVELRAISSCDVSKHMFTAKNSAKTKELAKQLTKSLCSVR